MTKPRGRRIRLDDPNVGRAEQYLADLIRGMRTVGYKVTVIFHDFAEFITFLRREVRPDLRISSYRFPSITSRRAVQAGLAMNRSWGGRLSFHKWAGLLLVYANILRSFFPILRILRRCSPDILLVNSGGGIPRPGQMSSYCNCPGV